MCQASSSSSSLQMTSHKTVAPLPDTFRTRCSSPRWFGSGTCRQGSRCMHHCSMYRRNGQERSRCSSPWPICHNPALCLPDTFRTRCSSPRWSGSGTCRWGSRCMHHCSVHRRNGQERSRCRSLQRTQRKTAAPLQGTLRNRHSLSASTSSETCSPHKQCTMPRPRL